MHTKMPKIVIVGGGFPGLEAAKILSDSPVEVVIIGKNNYYLFTKVEIATLTLAMAVRRDCKAACDLFFL